MNDLAGRTVLITGAGGFVGRHAARRFAERGAHVHGTGGPEPADLPLAGWHESDLREPETLAAAIVAARPDVVLHLAGQSSAAHSFGEPIETFHVNALGTWHLLEALRAHAPRARTVVVTSGEIYGPGEPGSRAAESAAQRPLSPYAISKAAADALAAIAAARGQHVVRARAFGHTGPGQESRFVIPTVAEQIAAAEAGRAEPVIRVGNLDVVRDLGDVRDVVRAYLAMIERAPSGAAYNVCTGVGVRLADVVRDLVARARAPIRIEQDPARMRPADVPYLVGDGAAIARDCGWQPEIPLARTLDDVLDEWRAKAHA